ncbi:MAG: ribosomal protein S18-alanine N-acetyltransferase [Thermodesulfobacteriota bacterium]
MRSCRNDPREDQRSARGPGWFLRAMEPGDLPQVMEIERASFRSPWSEGMFRDELANPLSRAVVAQKAEGGPRFILGYICAWFVAGEVHIMNLATCPGARRRGVARDLLRWVVTEGAESGASRVFLEVREFNQGAQALYASEGFQVVGRRPGYYQDTGEDALVMVLNMERDHETP